MELEQNSLCRIKPKDVNVLHMMEEAGLPPIKVPLSSLAKDDLEQVDLSQSNGTGDIHSEEPMNPSRQFKVTKSMIDNDEAKGTTVSLRAWLTEDEDSPQMLLTQQNFDEALEEHNKFSMQTPGRFPTMKWEKNSSEINLLPSDSVQASFGIGGDACAVVGSSGILAETLYGTYSFFALIVQCLLLLTDPALHLCGGRGGHRCQ